MTTDRIRIYAKDKDTIERLADENEMTTEEFTQFALVIVETVLSSKKAWECVLESLRA